MVNPAAIVVLVTTESHDEATRIANQLVNMHLAACVQILPAIESVYRWEGKIEHATEVLILAKTTQDKFTELEAVVRTLHSYTTPEIIALPITLGSASYLDWLYKSVNQ